MVTLVGAGPGDPGLLTLAGRAALERAEVVLFDRLVGREILALVPPGALAVDVGKNKGDHPVPQEEINDLILRHARDGKRVVRLKGGDPYLFGRGAEELEALAGEGIPFRVVPGVTSAIAAPAYAGIPVTHRDFSSSLHILTGHGKDGSKPKIAYRELAGLGGTLAFLMGLSAIRDIASGLIGAGMPPDTPAAVVEHGSRPDQRRLSGTVGDIADTAEREGARSPAILVVGSVCALAEKFDWTARLPLRGRRALVVNSRSRAGRLAGKLREYGCGVDEFCAIRQEPVELPESFWNRVPGFSWIVLTSRFGVELFFPALLGRGLDARRLANCKFAVVGRQTAARLRDFGVVADCVPEIFDSDSLGRDLAARLSADDDVLLFRAEEGAEALPRTLAAVGARVEDVTAYVTKNRDLDAETLENLRRKRYDAVAFASASSVRALALAAAGVDFSAVAAVCIGEKTAAEARALGFGVHVAPAATLDDMAETLVRLLGRTP